MFIDFRAQCNHYLYAWIPRVRIGGAKNCWEAGCPTVGFMDPVGISAIMDRVGFIGWLPKLWSLIRHQISRVPKKGP